MPISSRSSSKLELTTSQFLNEASYLVLVYCPSLCEPLRRGLPVTLRIFVELFRAPLGVKSSLKSIALPGVLSLAFNFDSLFEVS